VQFDFSIQVTLPLKTAGMTGTIQLDGQLCFMAVEIDNSTADSVLPAEL